jgi:hypothetical protein
MQTNVGFAVEKAGWGWGWKMGDDRWEIADGRWEL